MNAPRQRRVLVLAYYFPPMGLSGVQRTAKFVKYLPDHGWEPVVLTVEPGGYFAFDETLLAEVEERGIEVVRTSTWDPTRAFGRKRRVPLPAEKGRRRLSALSQWVFIPDNKIGWAPAALRRGARLIREGSFDAVLSTAPPYSSHVIAARLASRFRLPLVLDYRDDWLENPRHSYPTPLHRWLHARLVKYVAGSADATVTINRIIAESVQRTHPAPCAVIPQGFDPADHEGPVGSRNHGRLRFVYAGVFYDRQSPIPFLRGLARLLAAEPALRSRVEAVFVGLFPAEARVAVKDLALTDVVTVEAYRSHREAMVLVAQADIPWLVVGAGPGQEQISTGKLYAYMGTGKPILGLVPAGAARETLEEYGASWCAHPDSEAEVDLALSRIVRLWLEKDLPTPSPDALAAYDRRVLSGRLAAVLETVAS